MHIHKVSHKPSSVIQRPPTTYQNLVLIAVKNAIQIHVTLPAVTRATDFSSCSSSSGNNVCTQKSLWGHKCKGKMKVKVKVKVSPITGHEDPEGE